MMHAAGDLSGAAGWLIGLLVVVTLVAFGLSQRAAAGAVCEAFVARVRGWWIMTGLMVTALLIGPGAAVVIVAVTSMGALREFLTLSTRNRADHWAFVASFFVILPVQFVSVWQGWYGFYSVFIPVYAFLILPMLSVLRGRTERFLNRVAETQWALMISVFALSHLPALLFLELPEYARNPLLFIAFLVLVVQGADLAQHFWSTQIGKTPIAPEISQSRTWEGFYGGVASGAAIGLVLFWLTPFAPWQAAVMGAVVSAVGGMGRIVMTAIKRDRGVTDWGHMSDGQGGFVDRMDSVIFAAPVFFHLTRFFWQTAG